MTEPLEEEPPIAEIKEDEVSAPADEAVIEEVTSEVVPETVDVVEEIKPEDNVLVLSEPHEEPDVLPPEPLEEPDVSPLELHEEPDVPPPEALEEPDVLPLEPQAEAAELDIPSAESPEEPDTALQPVEPDVLQEEQAAEPDHAGAGGDNIEPLTETEPPDEEGVAETREVGEDQAPLETEPVGDEGVGDASESMIIPEGVEETAEDQPTTTEDKPLTGLEVIDSTDPESNTDVNDSLITPDIADAPLEAVEVVKVADAPMLPKSQELADLEKIEKQMAKDAAEEARAAGIMENIKQEPCNIQSPEKLNAESFFKSLKALQEYLKPSETTPSTYVASKKIQQLVTSMRSEMTCLREFCEATQAQMETVREPIKVITDQILSAIPKPAALDEALLTPAALDADLQQKTAHSQLAKISEALLTGMKLVAQTESAVADAQMAVVEAIELARKVHAEAEQRLKNEMEAKRLAIEAEKEEVARKKREEEMKIAQALIDAEMLKKRAETAGKEIKPVVLSVDPMYEFDGGIGCIFYSELLTAKMLKCTSVDLKDAEFEYIDNEELISHIIRIEPVNKLTTIRSPLKIAIPHGLTRQQATIREVFIKMQLVHPDGPWKELVTNDVAIEGFRDIKFGEVSDLKEFATFAVVSRFKLDLIKLKKRGGTSASKIDERVEFIYDPGSFNVREKVILQIQPVDSATITELKRSLDVAKGLLCSTAIFRTTWRNTNFESPVTISMILPPNPVAARKLAAERFAKDGKRSKTLLTGGEGEEDTGKKKGTEKGTDIETIELSLDEIVVNSTVEETGPRSSHEPRGSQDNSRSSLDPPEDKQAEELEEPQLIEVEEHAVHMEGEQLEPETTGEKSFAESHSKKKSKKDEESEERKALWRTPVKWYMGKYGKDVEDERDQLFLVRQNAKKGHWTIEPYRIDVGKFDKIFVELLEPVEVFAVFRVSMNLMERDVERIADALEAVLTRRLVRFIVKQHFSDPCEVIACIVPTVRMERIMKRLADDDYSDGPEMSGEFLLKEGDNLSLLFRGNIVCEDSADALSTIFTTNLDTRFRLRINANDVYVQKSYDVYRGFVQLRRVFQVLIKPEEPKKKDAKTLAAEKAAAAMAAKKAAEEAEMNGGGEEGASVEPGNEGGTEVKAKIPAMEEGSKGDENKLVRPSALTDPLEPDEPPMPLYETKEEVLTESLITFPKDSIALTLAVPKKAPITYIPLNDNITLELLKKLSEQNSISESDWRIVLDELGVKRNIQTYVRRHGDIRKLKQNQIRYDALLQWVKMLEKSTDKLELLHNALVASQNADVAKLLANIIAGKPELGRFSRMPDELTPEEEEAKQLALKFAQQEDEDLKAEEGKGIKLQLKFKKAALKNQQ